MLKLINKPKGYFSLAADLLSGATTMDVYQGQDANLPSTFPFRVTVDYEIIEVTSAVGNVGNVYRYNVTRGMETDLGAPAASAHGQNTPGELRATAGTLKEVQDAVTVAPSGSIVMYGGTSAPSGWLICDGSQASRSTYSALFAIVGTTFGAGNGTTTFNLPDLRDRFAIGKSGTKALGSTGGAATVNLAHDHGGATDPHTLITAELPAHSHNVTYNAIFTAGGAEPAVVPFNGALTLDPTSNTGSGTAHDHDINSDLSATQSVLNPYQAVNFIIKT